MSQTLQIGLLVGGVALALYLTRDGAPSIFGRPSTDRTPLERAADTANDAYRATRSFKALWEDIF